MGARSILAIMFAVLVPFGAACSSQSDTPAPTDTDTVQLPPVSSTEVSEPADQPTPQPSPRDDWVEVFDSHRVGEVHTYKRCDGTTLLYYLVGINKGGAAVIPNSPECQEL